MLDLSSAAAERLLKTKDKDFDPGIGLATARRTYLRDLPSGEFESRRLVGRRVAVGNTSLVRYTDPLEAKLLESLIASGLMIPAGRHLQQGDEMQVTRPQEIMTNCFHRSTKILTAEYGVVEIQKIVGETVTVRAKDGQWRPALVSSHGEQNLQRITFTALNGQAGNSITEVIATPNHRWFLDDGSETTALSIGHKLLPAPIESDLDYEGMVHGLVYGDGSAHKNRHDHNRTAVSQGRTYASIRVCKEDNVKETIHDILDKAGFKYTTPPHAKGDRVYYIGKKAYFKELPYTTDPAYIAGFIRGWWLADGSKFAQASRECFEISTASEAAAEWLKENGAYAGLSYCGYSVKDRTEGDGSYANGKALHVIRLRESRRLRVTKIEAAEIDEVFCLEEPITGGFVLANGLLTGNCSTSPLSSTKFLLLLNGSGVGRSYDNDVIFVDWNKAPELKIVLNSTHKDYGQVIDDVPWSDRFLEKFVNLDGQDTIFHEVEDSREGWAKAMELYENLTYLRTYDIRCAKRLVLDFSKVRPKGAPIGGMQNRPSSGPVPLMHALLNVADVQNKRLRDAPWSPWMTNMAVDHEIANCVAVGGARRAARIACKQWYDHDIEDFVRFKRDNMTEKGGSYYNSSNNSVMVDKKFWSFVNNITEHESFDIDEYIDYTVTEWGQHATSSTRATIVVSTIGRAMPVTKYAARPENARIMVSRYSDSGTTHSSGNEATSVVICIVTPSSVVDGTNARNIHQKRRFQVMSDAPDSPLGPAASASETNRS